MYRTITLQGVFGLLTTFALASFAVTQQPTEPSKEDPVGQNSIEVQTRGPLHEAFAQPIDPRPEPSAPSPNQPPAPIPEEPPTQRPEAENTQWIPGYWAWDAERRDYLWVSGVYRVAPQGRTYVPGYWIETSEGWRWVNGFWAPTQQQDLPVTPQPPAPLDEAGPQYPAPDDNSTYVQGSWIYRESRFVWRPGYWAAVRPGRVWIGAHYNWSPNGYLYNDGYWDAPLEDRGLVFAPVFFHQPLWRTPGWAYRPGYVVNLAAFFDSGFVRGGSFYFGNYYGANYARAGYNPWYNGRGRYDPVFAYHGWQNHRNNPNWVGGVQQSYAARNAGQVAVPPRTFAQQNALVAKNGKTPRVVAPLNQAGSVNSVRLVEASATQISTQKAAAQQIRDASVNRSRLDVGRSGEGKSPNVMRALTSPSGARPNGPTITNNSPQQPKIINNPQPQVQPRINNNPPVQPRIINNPQPQVQPRIINNPQPQVQPRIINNPPVQPKINNPPPQAQPRIINNPPPQPKINNPPPQAQPRIINNPPPQPKINNPPPQPRMNNPAPQPRINPAPQIKKAAASTPVAPRVQSAPAPRVQQAAPIVRSNPAPAPARSIAAPRPSGGGGKKR